MQSLPGVEGLAIATSCEFMMELQRSAIDNDIEPGPSCIGGWKPWLQAVKAASQGHLPPGTPPGMPLSPPNLPSHQLFSPRCLPCLVEMHTVRCHTLLMDCLVVPCTNMENRLLV